jgi:signal peptidase I
VRDTLARKDKSENETPEQKQETIKQKILAFLREAGIVLGLFLVINNFVVASFLVPTGSMENEVLTGELLFVNKFLYGGSSPRNIPFTNVRLPYFQFPALRDVHRGDVIVFVWPGYREDVQPAEFQFYLKRCVAISGDTLSVKGRALYVNGRLSPLPRNIRIDDPTPKPAWYVEDRIFPPGMQWNEDNYGPIVVPKKGMKIPLSSQDFHEWEVFIGREGHSVSLVGDDVVIDGVPVKEYAVQRDYLFGMGDHRDNSLDSRYWGFIPKESLVGTPMIVYWSWNTDIPLYDIFSRIGSIRWGRIGSLIK